MVTHEFSGALLLRLPPSALSVIAVNMPPVRHSLLTASAVQCACVFLSRDVNMKCYQGVLSSRCAISFM